MFQTVDPNWTRAQVQWLWEETHVLKIVGLNPRTVQWIDISIVKFVMIIWNDENKQKRVWGRPLLKKIVDQTVKAFQLFPPYMSHWKFLSI